VSLKQRTSSSIVLQFLNSSSTSGRTLLKQTQWLYFVIVTAVNRGGDMDTVGAVTGAIAGARFGCDGLPDKWFDEIDYRDALPRLGPALATTDIQAAL
jgi:hypothetical protein